MRGGFSHGFHTGFHTDFFSHSRLHTASFSHTLSSHTDFPRPSTALSLPQLSIVSSFLRGASDTQPEGSRADGSFWIVLNVGCTSVRVLGAGGWRGQRRSELASEGVTVLWPISWPDAHEHIQFS